MDEETYVGLSDAPSVDLGKDFVCFCPYILVALANRIHQNLEHTVIRAGSLKLCVQVERVIQ